MFIVPGSGAVLANENNTRTWNLEPRTKEPGTRNAEPGTTGLLLLDQLLRFVEILQRRLRLGVDPDEVAAGFAGAEEVAVHFVVDHRLDERFVGLVGVLVELEVGAGDE